MHLCRIGGIPLGLHWSFLVLLVYLSWEGWSVAEWHGLIWILGFTVSVFTCVVLHELGHAVTARRFGIKVPRILLLPIGGMAEFNRIPRNSRQEILIALAGPAVNALLAIGLWAVGVRFSSDWQVIEFPLTLGELGRHLVLMNVVMGIFNLLPIFPMDGGRVFRAVLALKFPYLRATFFASLVGKLLATLGIGTMLLALGSPHWLGAALFAFIFLAGEMEYRAVRNRDEIDQHWQETWERFERQTAQSRSSFDVSAPVEPDDPEKNSLRSNSQL